jgi:hypothetical protein
MTTGIITGAVIGGSAGAVCYKVFGCRSLWRMNPLRLIMTSTLIGIALGYWASISFN